MTLCRYDLFHHGSFKADTGIWQTARHTAQKLVAWRDSVRMPLWTFFQSQCSFSSFFISAKKRRDMFSPKLLLVFASKISFWSFTKEILAKLRLRVSLWETFFWKENLGNCEALQHEIGSCLQMGVVKCDVKFNKKDPQSDL